MRDDNYLDDEEAALRDKFAIAAIYCFTLNDDGVAKLLSPEGGYPRHDVVAKFCYDLANTMIAERRRRAGILR